MANRVEFTREALYQMVWERPGVLPRYHGHFS